MMINPTSPCVDCGKPIDNGHWYYGTGRAGGKDGYHHSACGDPLGIEAAVAAERERCAKIADAYAEHCKRGGPLSSMAEDAWGAVAALAIAKTIRDSATHQQSTTEPK